MKLPLSPHATSGNITESSDEFDDASSEHSDDSSSVSSLSSADGEYLTKINAKAQRSKGVSFPRSTKSKRPSKQAKMDAKFKWDNQNVRLGMVHALRASVESGNNMTLRDLHEILCNWLQEQGLPVPGKFNSRFSSLIAENRRICILWHKTESGRIATAGKTATERSVVNVSGSTLLDESECIRYMHGVKGNNKVERVVKNVTNEYAMCGMLLQQQHDDHENAMHTQNEKRMKRDKQAARALQTSLGETRKSKSSAAAAVAAVAQQSQDEEEHGPIKNKSKPRKSMYDDLDLGVLSTSADRQAEHIAKAMQDFGKDLTEATGQLRAPTDRGEFEQQRLELERQRLEWEQAKAEEDRMERQIRASQANTHTAALMALLQQFAPNQHFQ